MRIGIVGGTARSETQYVSAAEEAGHKPHLCRRFSLHDLQQQLSQSCA